MASPKVKSLLRDNKIDEIDFFSHRSFKASSKTRRNAKFSSKKIKKTKRVKGYCISESFQMKDLFSFLATNSENSPTKYGEVIFLEYDKEEESCIFLFPYGACVFWGLDAKSERNFLSLIKKYQNEPFEHPETDYFEYSYGNTTKFVDDQLFLEDNDNLVKLAFSHGVAQSVKLATFEESIESLIEETKYLPVELAEKGKINLSPIQISKLIGKLFHHRTEVNLHSDILDVPEYFWVNDHLEKYYIMAANHLDKDQRVQVLDNRMTVVADLLDVLREELHVKNDHKLEWIIIILILLDIIVEFFDVLFTNRWTISL